MHRAPNPCAVDEFSGRRVVRAGRKLSAPACAQRFNSTQQDHQPLSREAPAGTLHPGTCGAMCLWSQVAVTVGFMRAKVRLFTHHFAGKNAIGWGRGQSSIRHRKTRKSYARTSGLAMRIPTPHPRLTPGASLFCPLRGLSSGDAFLSADPIQDFWTRAQISASGAGASGSAGSDSGAGDASTSSASPVSAAASGPSSVLMR